MQRTDWTRVARLLSRRIALTFCVALAAGALLSSASAFAQSSSERIIVSGASGQLGQLVIEELLARGVPAKNLILVSRTPETLDAYKSKGASTRFGDVFKPESLRTAYAGGTRMLLISISLAPGSGPRAPAHKQAIDAAVAAGVKQIAYTSYVAISKGDTSGLASDHYQTEEALKKSGVAWTFLRNSIYMEVLSPQAAEMMKTGRATVPPQEYPVAYVTRRDCAAAAAAVLTTPGHDNKAYDITGPELIGVRELARTVSAVSGKKIELVTGSADAAPRMFGGPSSAVISNDVEKLTGHAPTRLKDFLAANKG